jgi:hypothetical protein
MAKALCNMHEGIGWPGLLGSLDCSHWNWAKCPKSLQGEHKKGSKDMPTVVYECACDYQLHIWHCHFALPGACNDLNVRSLEAHFIHFNFTNSYNMYWMYRHLLFKSRMARHLQILSWNLVFTNNRNDPPPTSSQRPLPPHLIENNYFVLRYVLVDGIYPKWSCFLGPISSPTTLSEKNYTLLQSARRKDIERAFGVLKIKFNILNKPSLAGNISLMNRTLRVCTILHNMVNTRHMYD